MSVPRGGALHRALCEPASLAGLSLREWESLIGQARASDLLARVAVMVGEAGVAAPEAPARHLAASILFCDAQHREVLREAKSIVHALSRLEIPVVLLKGTGYVAAQVRSAAGRIFTDVDILVPKESLSAVEATLMVDGWATTHHTEYDQRYYREWMHELPPMQHGRRQTVLDIHHAILPLTARIRPDSRLLIGDSVAASDVPGARVLAPRDMVLHSATHLFHNEEFSHGLRDLSDIDLMTRQFAGGERFWEGLLQRASVLQLERPLFYAMRYARDLLATPVPAGVLAELARSAPPQPLLAIMDACWHRALAPAHPAHADWLTPGALFGLYLRSHWLKMPPMMLSRHLLTKAWMRMTADPEALPERTG